jgi:hypothetical protein
MKKLILKTALLACAAIAGNANAVPVSGQGTWETTLPAHAGRAELHRGPRALQTPSGSVDRSAFLRCHSRLNQS